MCLRFLFCFSISKSWGESPLKSSTHIVCVSLWTVEAYSVSRKKRIGKVQMFMFSLNHVTFVESRSVSDSCHQSLRDVAVTETPSWEPAQPLCSHCSGAQAPAQVSHPSETFSLYASWETSSLFCRLSCQMSLLHVSPKLLQTDSSSSITFNSFYWQLPWVTSL